MRVLVSNKGFVNATLSTLLNKNCDDIIFVMTYSSFIKLKWYFKKVMQNVVHGANKVK